MYSEESLPQIHLVEGEEGDVGRQGETRYECHKSVSSARYELYACVSPGPCPRSRPTSWSAFHRKPLPTALPLRFPDHPGLLLYIYCLISSLTILHSASLTQL